jgi:hypothetical protein
LSASLVEIEERWTMVDVLDGHSVLDLYDELDAKAARQ